MKRLLFFLLLLPALGLAQEPTPQLPPTIEPPIGTGTDPQQPAAPDEERVSLNLPNATIEEVLLNYERISGKRLIRDANMAGGAPMNITIVSLPKSEALDIIETTLLLNNYALVPYGADSLKVLNISGGKSPRSEAPPVYASPGNLPAGDQVITYYMPFKYLSAAEAQNIMQSQATGSHPYAMYLPVTSTQALLITENTSVIRQLLEIRELIDVPPAKIASEFVPLMRADAERVAETITKMIEAQKNNQSNVSGGAPGVPQPPPNPDGSAPQIGNMVFTSSGSDNSPNSLFSGQVQLVPDTRTNRILVIARPTSFPYVKGLIQEFDQAVGLTDPLEMSLKYATAAEILPVLADLLAEDPSAAGGSGSTPQAPQTPQQTRSLNNNNNNNNGRSGGIGSTGSGAGGADLAELQANADLGPESRIVGKTRIIADNKANSILVIGPPESLEKCRVIISRLDKKPQQVYLSTVIGQLRLANNNEYAVNYFRQFTGNDSGVAIGSNNSISTAASVVVPNTLRSVTDFPANTGLNVFATLGDTLDVYVRALQSTNRFKVLSRPVVYTANNKLATISSGQRIAVPTQTLTNNTLNTDGTASLTSNIDYEDVVLELQVVPLINSNNEVTLQVAQKNDSVSGSQTIAGQTVPTISTQTISTTVTVANKHVVVLGGLITDSKTNNKSGIPVLSSIPVLGNLFRGRQDNTERNELIIFIQPNVITDNDDARRESSVEELRNQVAPSAHELAEPPVPDATPLPELKPFRK